MTETKTQKPLISIIVPIYKVEKLLDRCIKSILAQTYENIEVILVDDGSPDNCPQMCDLWAEKDGRIRVVHKSNGGHSSARNAGLEVMSGEYVGFIDSDDWINPEMFEELYNILISNGADAAKCKFSFIDKIENVDNEEITVIDGNSELRRFIITSNANSEVTNMLFKSSLFNEVRFDESLKLGEDWKANYELMCRADKIALTNKKYYHYIYNPNSIMSSKDIQKFMDNLYIANYFWNNELENKGIYDSLCDGYITNLTMTMNHLIKLSVGTKDERLALLRKELRSKRKYFKKANISQKTKIKYILSVYLFRLYYTILKKKMN